MKQLNKVFLIAIIGAFVLTMAIIFMPNSINNYVDHPELLDTGFSYYMWKFPPSMVSNIARITAWTFFALHLLTNVYLFRKLRNEPLNEHGYRPTNITLLIVNGLFIILHYIHTWIWYDALAQDTPVWSSQGSVIVMLVMILIMENNRRGLFFGKKIKFPKESTSFFMKHHGMYIAFATIFTFWYHPLEFTYGHLFGFFYMFMLFIQMSMARTKIHNNFIWKLVLEVTVLFHGTFVALDTNNAPWAMFLFGFAAMFFITQIYGLKLSKKVIILSQIGFLLSIILVYSGLFTDYTIVDANEVIRIPFIEYGLAFAFVYVVYLPIYLNKFLNVSKVIKRILLVLLWTVLLLSAGLIIFANSPYQVDLEVYDYMVEYDIEVSNESGAIVYEPSGYDTNIVLIPGGKVVPLAYQYIANELAGNGYKVTIVKPLLNLAILNPNQASNYLEDDKVNVVIGHSLGGVVASMVTANNDVDYLIMMGSYNIREITTAETLVIRAEYDIQLDMDTYNENIATISNLTEYYIEGGNHAYFGFYGEQRGDGVATISTIDQQNEVVAVILDFLE
jgi:hypothetical protein